MARKAAVAGVVLVVTMLCVASEGQAQIMGSRTLPSERLGSSFYTSPTTAAQFSVRGGGTEPTGPLAVGFAMRPGSLGGGFGPSRFELASIKSDLAGLRLRTLESASLAKRARFSTMQQVSLELAGMVAGEKVARPIDMRRAFYQFIFPFGLRDKSAEYGYGYFCLGCLNRALVKDPERFLAEFTEETQGALADEQFVKAAAAMARDGRLPEGQRFDQFYDSQLAAMGNYLFSNRRYAAAVEVWSLLARRDATSSMFALAAGQSLFAARQFEAASDELRRSLTLSPHWPKAAAAKAAQPAAPPAPGPAATPESNKTPEAPAPQFRITGANLQNIYADPGDLAEARMNLEGLLQTDKANKKLQFLMAYIDLFHGLWDRAQTRLQALAPEDEVARQLLGALTGGRVAEAIQRPFAEDELLTAEDVANLTTDVLLSATERRAIAEAVMNPKSYQDYMNRGDYYFFMGAYVRANQSYAAAAKLEPQNAVALFAEAHAAFANAEFSYAALKLKEALRMQPNWGLFNFRLEEFFGSRKDMDKRVQDLEHLIELRPGDSDARLLLGYVCYFDGRYNDAAQLLGQACVSPNYQMAEHLLKLARLQS